MVYFSIFQGQLESKGKQVDDMSARLRRAEKNVEDLENASIPMSAPAFCTPQKGNRPKSSSGERSDRRNCSLCGQKQTGARFRLLRLTRGVDGGGHVASHWKCISSVM